jgi:hypothetical protein
MCLYLLDLPGCTLCNPSGRPAALHGRGTSTRALFGSSLQTCAQAREGASLSVAAHKNVRSRSLDPAR